MRDAVSTGAFLSSTLTVGSELLVDEASAPAPPPVFDAGVDLAPVPVLLDVAVSALLLGVVLEELVLVSVAVAGSELAVLDWIVDVLLDELELGVELFEELLVSGLDEDVFVSVAVLLSGVLELELAVLLEELELVAGSSLVAGVVGSAGLAGSSGVVSGMSSYHIVQMELLVTSPWPFQ